MHDISLVARIESILVASSLDDEAARNLANPVSYVRAARYLDNVAATFRLYTAPQTTKGIGTLIEVDDLRALICSRERGTSETAHFVLHALRGEVPWHRLPRRARAVRLLWALVTARRAAAS